MSELTYQKLVDIQREIQRAAPRGLVSPFQNLMAGMKVIEAPPPPPKIQMRDIKFTDGTSILPAAELAEMNAWLAARFGYQDDPFKDSFYIFQNEYLIGNAKNIAMVRNASF